MQVHDEEQYPGKAQLEMLSVVQQEFLGIWIGSKSWSMNSSSWKVNRFWMWTWKRRCERWQAWLFKRR